VIGAGPNGLVAANVLADHGWSVEVHEASSEPGGSVRSGEITVAGFRHDLFSAFYPLALASPALRSLDLEGHGLRWAHAPLVLAHPLPDGRCATLSTDLAATADGLGRFAAGDGEAWVRMIEDWDRVAAPLMSALLGPFPPVTASVRLARRVGAAGLLRLVRQAVIPVRRMTEELFRGEGAGLLLGGSALHADLCPEGSGSGFYGWLLSCLGQRYGFPVPVGGAGSLSAALVARLHSRGGTIQCGSRITRVLVRGNRAVGVENQAGNNATASRAVLADVSAPALYHQLVGDHHLPPGFLADLSRFHWDTSTVKIDWALSRTVPWTAPEAAQAGTVHIADDFDNLTEFSAHLAMGLLPARPFLLFGQQSRADPSRSPEGTETAWAYTHVPRSIRGDAAGELGVDGNGRHPNWLPGFLERIENRVERLAPGFRASILGRHHFGPSDMESTNPNLSLGAIGGGTAQLHQQLVLRPVPGWGRAETPITGLYLASSSAHPGGGVHGAPGANAARAALLNMGRVRSAVLGRGLA